MKNKQLTERELQEQILDKWERIHNIKCKECCEQVTPTTRNKYRYIRCKNRICPLYRKQISIWNDSFLDKIHISKYNFLRIIEYWLVKTPIYSISYILGISKKCIYNVIKKISSVLVERFYKNIKYLGIEDEIIEIDESKLGKRKYNKGHPVEGVWIFGLVERDNKKKCLLFQVDDRTKSTLHLKINQNVKEGSTIYSDCWKSYMTLSQEGYNHGTVNHSKFFKDPITGIHTNTIEGTWSALKRHIPYRNRTKKLINPYLVRFMLLKNYDMHPLFSCMRLLFNQSLD